MYGLTSADFEALSTSQDGRCAICGDAPDMLHIDHDHDRQEIRALLCGPCNRMLGLAHDDPRRLAAGIRYLADHGCPLE